MATKKEVTNKLTAMEPGEDVLIIKTGPDEFDIIKLHWQDVPAVVNKQMEVGK